MNKVILMGNITKDLELKQTPNWHNVLSFSIATNSKVKKWEEWVDKAEFHNLVAWGKTAETINNFCWKWSKILIEGQIETRNWEVEDGSKRYRTEIIVRNFEFAGSKGSEEKKTNYSKPKVEEEISIEDIPF